MNRRIKPPSPAMIVASAALIVALAGTAVATPIAIKSLNKKEKKVVKKIANKRINKRAPGLSVASAKNADLVDGLDANSLVRVAGDSSDTLPDGAAANADVLTANITAPRAGFLHIVGSVDMFNGSLGGDIVGCGLDVDGGDVTGTLRTVQLDGDRNTSTGGLQTVDVNAEEDCATNGVRAVGAGAHTVDLELSAVEADTILRNGALNVLFVPFDGSGS